MKKNTKEFIKKHYFCHPPQKEEKKVFEIGTKSAENIPPHRKKKKEAEMPKRNNVF